MPVNKDARILGRRIFMSVVNFDFPNVNDASFKDPGRFLNPATMGLTINGKLYITDATTKPVNVNTRRKLKYVSINFPNVFAGLKAINK